MFPIMTQPSLLRYQASALQRLRHYSPTNAPQITSYSGTVHPRRAGRYSIIDPDGPQPHVLALHTAPVNLAVMTLADIAALQVRSGHHASVIIQLATTQTALIRLITISDIRCVVVESTIPISAVAGTEGYAGIRRPWIGVQPSADRPDFMLLHLLAALYRHDTIDAVANACVLSRPNIYRRFARYGVASEAFHLLPRQWADNVCDALAHSLAV